MLGATAITAFMEWRFLQKAHTGSGKVIELRERESSKGGTLYYPVTSFTTKSGQTITITSTLGTSPPAYEVGEQVAVYYLPENPSQAEVKGFFSQWFAPFLTSIFTIIFGGVGMGFLLAARLKKRKQAWLQQHGKAIEAKVTFIQKDRVIRINGRRPYRIYCQWQNPQTNQIQIFKSEPILYDLRHTLTPETFTVLIDEQNPRRYYVDISALSNVVRL